MFPNPRLSENRTSSFCGSSQSLISETPKRVRSCFARSVPAGRCSLHRIISNITSADFRSLDNGMPPSERTNSARSTSSRIDHRKM